jgi:hypothetical protein
VAFNNLANAYGDLGEMQRAADFYRQSAIKREVGDRQGIAGAELGE